MPKTANNNGSKQNEDEVTIKEASQKLDISESTVKKYLKDFELPIEKGPGNKGVLSQETFKALLEISKLRTNGLSIQEIKELKTQEPTKTILDQVEEGSKTKKEDVESTKDVNIPADELLEVTTIQDELDEEKKEEEVEVEEDQIQEEEAYKLEQEPQGLPRRRRLFNFRYVERQVSGDSKRVNFLRQRLKNPNLSNHDKLFYEEALERRILLLDGWKHILRWIGK